MTPLWFSPAFAEEMAVNSLEHAVETADVVADVILRRVDADEVEVEVVSVHHADAGGINPVTAAAGEGSPVRYTAFCHSLCCEDGPALAGLGFADQPWELGHNARREEPSVTWIFGGSHCGYGVRGAEVTVDQRVLTSPAEIRAAVLAWIRQPEHPHAPYSPLWIDLNEGPAYDRLWAGSGVHMFVPPLSQFLPSILDDARSGDPNRQLRAAYALRYYPEAGTAELAAMLGAAAERISGAGGVPLGLVWRARDAAWTTLAHRGALPDPGWITVERRDLGP
jgi:hypothetical protein